MKYKISISDRYDISTRHLLYKKVKFGRLTKITVDDTEEVYVINRNSYDIHQILKFTQDGGFDRILHPQVNPYDIAMDNSGHIYAISNPRSDKMYNLSERIVKYSPENETLFTIGWMKTSHDKGIFHQADMYRPTDIAIDSQNNIYVLCKKPSGIYIHKFSSDGSPLTNWEISPSYSNWNDSHTNLQSLFDTHTDIATDSDGHIYVIDSAAYGGYNNIRRFQSTGKLLNEWKYDECSLITGIVIDSSGHILVVDSKNCEVCIFSSDGELLGKWDCKDPGDGTLDYPNHLHIAVGNSGNVYIADGAIINSVKVFTPEGKFLHKWEPDIDIAFEAGKHEQLCLYAAAFIYASIYGYALKCCDKAIQINPNCADSWCIRGMALSDNPTEALRSYDRAIRIQPDHISAWYSRGVLLFLDMGRHREALVSMDKAIQIKPGDVKAGLIKAWILAELGSREDALKCLNQAHIRDLSEARELRRQLQQQVSGQYEQEPVLKVINWGAKQAESCYIVTMCFGIGSPEYMDMVYFRDNTLRRYGVGRAIIYSYYRIGGQLVKHLGYSSTARAVSTHIVRGILVIVRRWNRTGETI